MTDKVILKYIGTGSLIEIPARDLTEQDLENFKWTGWTAERLVAETRLYEFAEKIEKEELLENIYEDITSKEIKKEFEIPNVKKETMKKRGLK